MTNSSAIQPVWFNQILNLDKTEKQSISICSACGR